MFKHIPSESDVDMLIDDQGNLFIFCKQLNKAWNGKLMPVAVPPTAFKATDTMKALKNIAISSRVTLESIGLEAYTIDALIK